jgi:hypothetical protein
MYGSRSVLPQAPFFVAKPIRQPTQHALEPGAGSTLRQRQHEPDFKSGSRQCPHGSAGAAYQSSVTLGAGRTSGAVEPSAGCRTRGGTAFPAPVAHASHAIQQPGHAAPATGHTRSDDAGHCVATPGAAWSAATIDPACVAGATAQSPESQSCPGCAGFASPRLHHCRTDHRHRDHRRHRHHQHHHHD